MSFVNVVHNKFAVMVAILALLTILAIGVLAKQKCVQYDDYGNCIMWELVDDGPGGGGLADLLGD